MTTIIINEKTKKGRIILDLIHEMGIGKIIEDQNKPHVPNKVTLKAIKDADEGRTVKCGNFNDYLEKVK